MPHIIDGMKKRGPKSPDVVTVVPDAVDPAAIRAKTGLKRTRFCARYGFNPRTYQDWESGKRRPDMAARVLLLVIDHDAKAVDAALEAAGLRRHTPLT